MQEAAYPGYKGGMEKQKQQTHPLPPEERKELREEDVEAKEGDKQLDDYDKAVADSFPASDPPAQP